MGRQTFLPQTSLQNAPSSTHDIPPPWFLPDSVWQMERHLTSLDDAHDNLTSSTADLDS